MVKGVHGPQRKRKYRGLAYRADKIGLVIAKLQGIKNCGCFWLWLFVNRQKRCVIFDKKMKTTIINEDTCLI